MGILWRRSCEPPAQEIDEEGRAGDGGDGTDGKFAGCGDGASKDVSDDHGDGSAECSGGKQYAVIGAVDHAHDVRYKQADIADGAADGDCKTGERGSGNVHDQAHAANVYTKVHGFLFAGEEEVEIGRSRINHHRRYSESYAQD